MKVNDKKPVLIFILILLTVFSGGPEERNLGIIQSGRNEYISLYDFIKLFDLSNSYDVVAGRGKLYYKSSVAVYQAGYSIILVNGSIVRSEYPIAVEKGEILLPVSHFSGILNAFFPEYSVRKEGGIFYITEKAEPLKKEGKEIAEIDNEKAVRRETDRITFIIIDPGHGGRDPGASAGGIKEKKITLDISIQLDKYLKGKLRGIKTRLTRRDDRFIELSKRTDQANQMLRSNNNGIFVSIHVNASIVKSVSGFETYFLSQTPSTDEARTTAALENNVVILEDGPGKKSYGDIDHIQALMLTTQIQKESSMLAACIQQSLDERIWENKSNGVKKADFFVLRGALLPAVLAEVGYISNRKELNYLRNKNYQKKIAEGIGNGLIGFIEKYNRDIKK